jgi:chromosomal replication initiator protein
MSSSASVRGVLFDGIAPSEQALLDQIEIEEREGSVFVKCPNLFIQQHVKRTYTDRIRNVFGRDIEFIISGKSPEPPKPVKRPVQMMLPEASPMAVGVNPKYTFDNFVVGNCNSFAFQAAQAVVEEGTRYSPLYYYSDTGLGKSHIAHAIGNGILGRKKGVKAKYTTAQDFSQEYVYAVRNDCLDKFKRTYRCGLDLLFIDDVHVFSSKEKTQVEVSSLLDDIMALGTQVVFAGYRPPGTIQQLDKGLKSRMSSGLMIHIKSPDMLTRSAIVRAKAGAEDIIMPEEVVEFISGTVVSNIRDLESAVMTVIAMASLMKREINMDIVHEALEGTITRRTRIDIPFIMEVVSKNFDIDKNILVSPSRKKDIAYPRQIAIYICRQLTRDSLQTIGEAFGRKHSSVIHTLEVMDAQYRDNLKTKKEVDFIMEKIEAGV